MKSNEQKRKSRIWRKWSALGAAMLCAGLVQAANPAQPASAAGKDDRSVSKASNPAHGPLLDGPQMTQSDSAGPVDPAHSASGSVLAKFEGKRDPFKLPPPPSLGSGIERIPRPANLPPGPRGLIVGDLKLEGVVSEDSGRDMIAVVTSSDSDRAYFLSENEQLYDGQVTRITPNAAYFTEKFVDRQGHETVREVVKSLTAGAGERR